MAVYDFAKPNPANDRNPYANQGNPWAMAGNAAPQQSFASTGAPATGGPEFDLSGMDSGFKGWHTNNWALQYDTLPWLREQIQFAKGLEPKRQQAILSLIDRLSNPEVQAQVFRMQQQGAGREEGYRLGQQLMSNNPTGGSALAGGAMLDASNRAAGASSNMDAYLQSPEGQQAALQAILRAISGGQTPSALGPYSAISQVGLGTGAQKLQGDAQNRSSSGLGGILGSVLGMATGGGGGLLGGLFGGGGGGGGDISAALEAALSGIGGLGQQGGGGWGTKIGVNW